MLVCSACKYDDASCDEKYGRVCKGSDLHQANKRQRSSQRPVMSNNKRERHSNSTLYIQWRHMHQSRAPAAAVGAIKQASLLTCFGAHNKHGEPPDLAWT